ncbi:hypothetical protein KHM83_00405 [Fusibacter paucivorans]|uniref:Uncharacterized protein n=1 Tax=Fusibacter paucivorans TaxID=76009 RepID=A0ABS5PJZ0_9FIRM|nr:hypothetical protein [Fusibacter paucivorans]MBS7525127.1 hypothetical protein [Fusibacter paucivorans]
MQSMLDEVILDITKYWYESLPTQPSLSESRELYPLKLIRFLRLKHSFKRSMAQVDRGDSLYALSQDPNMMRFVALGLGFKPTTLNQMIGDQYLETTDAFLKRARETAPQLENESIYQALRNVWIANTIQVFMGHPVELTDAIFAYSMLYPLSDNLLDDPDLSGDTKRHFLTRFRLRLTGEHVLPQNDNEAMVFQMIKCIEMQFDRFAFPEVYDHLLAIHDAQADSLRQQERPLSKAEILTLTFTKGATSVLADGYLINGTMTPEMYRFLTYYGIVLQLCDDLQDQMEDKCACHQTIFSTASNELLVRNTLRLYDLSQKSLNLIPACADPAIDTEMKLLLSRSIAYLICDAIFTHRKRYVKTFYAQCNRAYFLTFKQQNALKQLMLKSADKFSLQFSGGTPAEIFFRDSSRA